MKQQSELSEEGKIISLLSACLRANGDLIPVTIEQVMAFEVKYQEDLNKASAKLPDPYELLARGRKPNPDIVNVEINRAVETQYYSAAARNGKEIPDEIRKKMNDDRNSKQKP
jgi:hypothetical protein